MPLKHLLFQYVSILILNTLLFGYFWFKTKNRDHRLFFIVWSGFIFSFFAQGMAHNSSFYIQALALSINFIPYLLYAGFFCDSIGDNCNRIHYITTYILMFTISSLLSLTNLSAQVTIVPLVFATSYPVLREGLRILIFRREKLTIVSRLLIIVTTLSAIHVLDYPILRFIPEAIELSFSIATLFIVSITTLTLASIMEQLASLSARLEIENEIQGKLSTTIKLASLGKMAGGMAHEINSPLGIIDGCTFLIRKNLQKQPIDLALIRNYNEKIYNTVRQISEITKSLLDYNRKDSGSVEITTVKQLMDRVLPICREKYALGGQVFFENIQVEHDERIRCNTGQLTQVFINLINNAFDACIDSINAKTEIMIRAIDDNLLISVIDNGEGIDVSNIDKVFDPFFTTKPPGKGTGLGLSLCKSLVEANNGEIFLDQNENKTSFTVQLKRVR